MALHYCSSSSSLMSTSLSPKSFSSSPNKALVLSFSMAASSKPSFQSLPLSRNNRTTQMSCQDKAACIPLAKRWMFEESEIDALSSHWSYKSAKLEKLKIATYDGIYKSPRLERIPFLSGVG